ncbi:MAG: MFS transporter [Rhodospirillales bacterium]|nr:MFS transporter [Rhodospirillales bacterium]MBO6786527.1 MFS transporter [Rhodospirillales bacterium]
MSRLQLIAYALPALALAMPTIPVYIYLPKFYAAEVGLGLSAVGAVLLASRIFDTVSDPVCGYVSDRLRWRFGRRKPLMLIGGVVAAMAMLALAHPPDGAGAGYLLAFSVLLYTGWTLVIIPYSAWGAELADDYDTRSKITAAREGMMLGGILLAAAIPVLLDGGASTASGGATESAGETDLRAVAWAAVLVGIPGFLIIAQAVPDAPPKSRPPAWAVNRAVIKRSISTILANKPFLRLFAAWFINGLANGFPAVLFILYMEHALGIGAAALPQYILGYFLPGVLFVPLWIWLSRSRDKHRVWCAAMLLASAAFAVVPFLSPDLTWVFMLVCIFTGATLGADLALPPSMQADVVDHDRLATGSDRTGIYFALWGMATKLALALAVGIAFPFLDLAGFDPAAAHPEAVWALVVIYALVPVVLKLIAVGIVAGFPIGRRQHELIRRQLAER